MANEHEGVSPASAGGAPAPDVAAPIEEVPPHSAYVENAVAGALTDMYGFLPLSVRYGAAAAARAAVESWQRMTGPAAVPDPRDAEIERLRGELDRVSGGWEARVEGRQKLTQERDQALAEVDELEIQRDSVKAANEYLRDAFREIGELVGVPQASPETVRPAVERYLFELDQRRGERDEARAERDRLRQELALIGERRPRFQPGQYVRVGLCDGIVLTPKDTTRVQFEGMLHTFDIPTRDVHAIDDIVPAEPRRWVVGDPEPEIGTTVTWGVAGAAWSRHEDRNWRSDACDCDSCLDAVGLPWSALLDAAATSGGLVEVVSTDD